MFLSFYRLLSSFFIFYFLISLGLGKSSLINSLLKRAVLPYLHSLPLRPGEPSSTTEIPQEVTLEVDSQRT